MSTITANQIKSIAGASRNVDALQDATQVDATTTAKVSTFSSQLSASSGSNLVGFLQSGTGAVARTLQSKSRDFVSVKDFGAVGDGVADDTAAIQAAITYAISQNYGGVYIPNGVFLVSSTLLCERIKIFGNGYGSRIKPTISNGTPVIHYQTQSFVKLESFIIYSDSLYQNCIGLRLGNGATTYVNRFNITDVYVRGCKFGADINGFIGDIDLFISHCETGIVCANLNASKVRLKIEECVNAGSISKTNGTSFHILYEGGAEMINGLLVDECVGVKFDTPYFESGATSTLLNFFIKFGATTKCRNVMISGGSTYGFFVSDAAWVFDRVEGLSVNQHWAIIDPVSSAGKVIRTTTNTKFIENLGFLVNTGTNGQWISDDSKSAKQIVNLFSNGNFYAGFKGFAHDVQVSGGIASLETTITRNSPFAIKSTMPIGITTSAGTSLRLPHGLRDAILGRTCFVGGWVYVPSTAGWDISSRSPAIGISDGITTTISPGGYIVPDRWNFVWAKQLISGSSTNVSVVIYPIGYGNASYTSQGTEKIILGELFVVDATNDIDPMLIASGKIINSNIGGYTIGKTTIISHSTIPSANSQSYSIGDTIVITAPTCVTEYSCVVAGSPGTWQPTKWITKKGNSGSRPTLTSNDIGVSYIDTTLDADGKLIWWTGVSWVDATGLVV